MDFAFIQSQVDSLNEFLQSDSNVSADAAITALHLLSDFASETNEADSAKLFVELAIFGKNGLLTFIKELRRNTDVDSEIASTSFSILEIVLFEHNICDNNILSVFDLCRTCIFWAQNLELRNQSIRLMKKLVKHVGSQLIPDFPSICKKLFDEILLKTESIQSSTEKKNIYELMGAIIETFPFLLPNVKDQNKIFRKLECDIVCLISKDKGIIELDGVLVCVNSFLINFYDNIDENILDSLYSSVKKICEKAKSRRTSAREALKLIGHHFSLLSKNIFIDYSWWHFVICDYLRSSNKDDYLVAFEVADFYYMKIAELLVNKPSEISGPVLDFFTSELKKFLSSFEKREMTIALKNIGYFAEPCKLHNKLNIIKEIFVQLAEIVEKFFLGMEEEIEVHFLADMLISVTNIIKYVPNKSGNEEDLNILVKLGQCLIMSYPKIPTHFHPNVIRALVRTFIEIASIDQHLLTSYLEQIVFVCLIQICSRLTENDVALLKELGASEKDLLSNKKYAPLWRDLCNLHNVSYLQSIPERQKFEFQRRQVDRQIFHVFIESTLNILAKLDFSVVEDQTTFENPAFKTNLSEVEVKNESDYIILNNLTELFCDVIESCELEMLENWIPILVKTFVEYAATCPIKGGFFQFLSVIFVKSESSFYFREQVEVKHLIHTLFVDMLAKVDEFQGPELITFLRMMMNAPISIVKDIILHRLDPFFKIVFVLGQEDLLLAQEGLKSLEKFYAKIPLQEFESVLYSTVPYLGYYLDSKNFSGETDSITQQEENLLMPILSKSKNRVLRKYSNKYVNSVNIDLFSLQGQIVKFLSTVDAKYCSCLYTSRIHTFVESYNFLKFEIPFADIKTNLFLDRYLPRCIEIACNSSDPKTRIVACEFLHSVTIIFIANSNFSVTYPKELRELFNCLISCILKLGSDVNCAVKQMFYPLCCQTTRYYASRPITENPATKLLLNLLFNGISNRTDSGFRYFCAKLIFLFVEWSIKQIKIDIRRSRIPVNIENVIKKICFFCTLPCSFKRLGAALSFVRIFRKLAEERNIFNEFWIEILLSFVTNLSLSSENDCNNEIAQKALILIGRMARKNSNVFSKGNYGHHSSFSSTKLDDVIIQLSKYCTSNNKYCRDACMNLIVELSQSAGYNSLNTFFDGSVSDKNSVLNSFLECLRDEPELRFGDEEANLSRAENLKKLLPYLQSLIAGVHCLTWFLKLEVITFNSILTIDSRYHNFVKFFGEKILPYNVETDSSNFALEFTDGRSSFAYVSNINSLKFQIFFLYLETLSYSSNDLELFIGNEPYQINLWNYFMDCLFNMSEIDSNASTERVLISVLKCFARCKSPRIKIVYSQIGDLLRTRKFWKILSQFQSLSEVIMCLNDQPYLRGSIMLQSAGILPFIMEDVVLRQEQIISNIFLKLNAENFVESTKTRMILILEDALSFCLPNIEEALVFNLIFDENSFNGKNLETRITRGRYFFITFKKLLVSYLSQHQQFFISSLFSSKELSKQKIQLILDCLSYQFNFDDLISVVNEKWYMFTSSMQRNVVSESYLFDFIQQSSKRYRTCDKFSLAFQLAVFQWLYDCLKNVDTPILQTERIIKLLPPFVSQYECAHNSQIVKSLVDSLPKRFLDVNGLCSLSETEFILIFKALLMLVRESRNVDVLPLIITFRSFDCNNDCDEEIEPSLFALIKQQPSDYQLRVLNSAFYTFKNPIRVSNSDFRVQNIQLFLVPLLRLSKFETVIKFYQRELSFLLQILKSSELNHHTSDEEKNAIIERMCAVILIETYSDCVKDLDCPEILLSLYPNGESTLRKDLTKLLRSIVQKNENLHDITNSSYLRQSKCYAFNALIKVIKKVQKEEKFYNLLFVENDRVGYIWKHLIDCRREIQLSMTPEEISSKKKNFIRKKAERRRSFTNTVRSLPSQYLSTSSLVEDIIKFDLSGWNKSEPSLENFQASSNAIGLEEEVLNKHECMVFLCELFQFLFDSGISPIPNLENNRNPEMRPWMTCLHSSLKYYLRDENRNVVMFILRLIFNCEDIFCPYASSWIDLILKCLVFLDEVNYFTSDIITMLTFTWHCNSRPKNEYANDLLRLLLKKIDVGSNSTVRNYQLDLIGAVIDAWHSAFDSNIVLPLSDSKSGCFAEINLKIAKRFLLHCVMPFNRENKAQYLRNLVQLTKSGFCKKVTVLLFEILSLILRAAKSDESVISAAESEELKVQMIDCLTSLRGNKTKIGVFFSALDHVILYYPEMVNYFLSYLLSTFEKLQGIFKIKCLKILTTVALENYEDSLRSFIRQQITNCLNINEYELQKQALTLLQLAAPKFEDQDIHKFLPILVRLSSHSSSECRSLVCDIVDCIYVLYKNKTGNEYEEIKLRCTTLLLNGLLDSDASLQQKMFDYWKSRSQLDGRVSSRFINIFREMYAPFNETQFVSYAVDFILEASSSVSDFHSLIFDYPLMSDDNFKEYRIMPSGSITRSILPEFPNSISQRVKSFSQSSASSSFSIDISPRNDFIFQPLLSNDASRSTNDIRSESQITESNSKNSSLGSFDGRQIDKFKLRRRLHSSTSYATEHFASYHVRRKQRQKTLLKEKYEKTNQKLTFCKTYRDGNFPDVQIPRSAVIIPLQILAKRDPTVAKLVLIHIFEEILTKITTKADFLHDIDQIFNNILKSSYKHDRTFVETLLEMAFSHEDISLNSSIVVTASHSSGLYSLGTLLLENYLLNTDVDKEHLPVSKKLRIDTSYINKIWIELAELYSSLNESDFVNGILQDKVSNDISAILQKGLTFEHAGNKPAAKKIYKDGLLYFVDRTNKSYDGRFITEAFFKCADYLSLWDEINATIRNQFSDLNDLWKDTWDVEHTLPWLLTSEAYLCIEHREISNLLNSINSWLESDSQSAPLVNLMAEQIAVLLICNDEKPRASLIVKDCLKFMINEWHHSRASLDYLHRLQILSEINIMLDILNFSNDVHFEDEIENLLKIWERSIPGKNNINFWDRRIMNRILFFDKCASRCLDTDLRQRLEHAKITSKLDVLESAFDQKNNYIGQKYFISLVNNEFATENNSEPVIPNQFSHRFWLNHSKVMLLQAINSDNTKKLDHFFICLDSFEQNKMNLDFKYYAHLAAVMSEILKNFDLFITNHTVENKLISQLGRILNKSNLNRENFCHVLSIHGVLENYEKSVNMVQNQNRSHSEISSVYLTMAKYCKNFIENGSESIVYKDTMIRSLMKAMKFDSKESQILFPTLLYLNYVTDNSLKEIFLSESNLVEEWKFLPWIYQLLAYVGTDFLPLVENLLLKIVRGYPNVLQLTFESSVENLDLGNPRVLSLIAELRRIIDPDLKLTKFIKAVSHIRDTGSFFDYWWSLLWKATTSSNFLEKVADVERNLIDDIGFKGELFSTHPLLEAFEECIETIRGHVRDRNSIEEALKSLKKKIFENQNADHSDKRELLEFYSPACARGNQWYRSEIEVPGQYCGFSMPRPERHIKVYSFHERVKVLCSKQKPIKIKIIGSDAKKYPYLVKFEEDMRQDQRIQQIYNIMNRCAFCSTSKNESIITYGVFPFATNFGIIEWVTGTTTLKDFMDYGLSRDEKVRRVKERTALNDEYHRRLKEQYVGRNLPSKFDVYEFDVYEEAVKKFDKNFITEAFRRCSRKIPEVVFRKSLLALCHSPSAFWNLRNQFMRSYSTMCIYGWILGIGDRHLKNTLVSLKDGRCFGIDFGYAFETGVECTRVPELIPFRMTPHLKSIMAPMYLTGLIRETMISTLQRIIESENIVVTSLQIFVYEPALNWLNLAKRRMQQGQNEDNEQDLEWHPMQKVQTMEKKLRGVHPAIILIDKVRKNQIINPQYKNACVKLITEEGCFSKTMTEDKLSVSDQVNCLLDLATNESILGTSWRGLETYI